MIECCKQEMVRAGDWYHCKVCGMRLRAHPYGKDQAILSELVIEEVHENIMTWKEFHAIFHELWRAGCYEDYEPNIPEEWMPTYTQVIRLPLNLEWLQPYVTDYTE